MAPDTPQRGTGQQPICANPASSRYTHVVWDWNGTLLDDLAVCMGVINEVLRTRNLPQLQSVSAYQAAFCFPISAYYTNLGFDFALESYDSLATAYMHGYDQQSQHCTLFDDVQQTLSAVAERGITQVVLSASERGRLGSQLTAQRVLHYFETYLGLNDVYANTKVDIGRQWLEAQGSTPISALMVGDTLHDFDVAEKLGFDCVLVATGHQNKDALKETGCPVLESVSEVLMYL